MLQRTWTTSHSRDLSGATKTPVAYLVGNRCAVPTENGHEGLCYNEPGPHHTAESPAWQLTGMRSRDFQSRLAAGQCRGIEERVVLPNGEKVTCD